METQTGKVYEIEHALDLAFKPGLSTVNNLRDLNEWLNSTLPDVLFASSAYPAGSFDLIVSNVIQFNPLGEGCMSNQNLNVAGVMIEQSRFKLEQCSYTSKVLPALITMCCQTGEETAEPFAEFRFVFGSAPWGYFRNCANFTMNVRASWVSGAILSQLVLSEQFTNDNAFHQLARSDSAFDPDPNLDRLSRIEVVNLFNSYVASGCSGFSRQYIYVSADDDNVQETIDSLGGADWPWATSWACAADPTGCARVTRESDKVCAKENTCSVGWTSVLCKAGTNQNANATGSDSDSDPGPGPNLAGTASTSTGSGCVFTPQSAAQLFCNGSAAPRFAAYVSPYMLNLSKQSPIQLGLDPSSCIPYVLNHFSLACGPNAGPPLTCLTSALCRSNEACKRSLSASILQACAATDSNQNQNNRGHGSTWTTSASHTSDCPSSIPNFIDKATAYLGNLTASQQMVQELSAGCQGDPECIHNGRYQAQVLCGAPWTCWSTPRKEFARSVIARRLVEEHKFAEYCFFTEAYQPVHGPRPAKKSPPPSPTSTHTPQSNSARSGANAPFTTNFARPLSNSASDSSPTPNPKLADVDSASPLPPGLEAMLPEDKHVSAEPFQAFISMFVPASFNRKFLSFLVQHQWMTSSTKTLKVGMLVFNPHIQLLTFVQIKFDIGPTGTVLPTLQYLTCDMFLFTDSFDFRRVFIEIVFLVCFTIQILVELFHISEAVRQKRFRKHACSLWTILLWANILFTAVIIASWAMQLYFLPRLAASYLALASQTSGKDSFDEFIYMRIFPDAQRWLSINRIYMYFNSMNIFFLFARSLSFLSFQGKMSLFNRTLVRSCSMLLHFVLVSMFIVVGFAEIGKLSFGHRVPEFHTFTLSLSTCFNMLLQTGNVDASYIIATEGFDPHKTYVAHFFYTMFNLFVTIILVNLFLAIVLEGYTYVAGHAAGSASLHEELALLLDTAKAWLTRLAKPIQRHRSRRFSSTGSLEPSDFKRRSDRELLVKLENIDPDLDQEEYQSLLDYVSRKTMSRNRSLRTWSVLSTEGLAAHGAEHGGYREVRQVGDGSGTVSVTKSHAMGRRGSEQEWGHRGMTSTGSNASGSGKRKASGSTSTANWIGGGVGSNADTGQACAGLGGPSAGLGGPSAGLGGPSAHTCLEGALALAAEMRGSSYGHTWGPGAGRRQYSGEPARDEEGDDPSVWDNIMDRRTIQLYRQLSKRFEGVDLLAESSGPGASSESSVIPADVTQLNSMSASSSSVENRIIFPSGGSIGGTFQSTEGSGTGPDSEHRHVRQTQFNVPQKSKSSPVTSSSSNPGGGHSRHHQHQRRQARGVAAAGVTGPNRGANNDTKQVACNVSSEAVSLNQVGIDGMLDALEARPLVPPLPSSSRIEVQDGRHEQSVAVCPVAASLPASFDSDGQAFLAQSTESGLRQRRWRGSGSESESEGRLRGGGLSPPGGDCAYKYSYCYSPSQPTSCPDFVPSLDGFVEVSNIGPAARDVTAPSAGAMGADTTTSFTGHHDTATTKELPDPSSTHVTSRAQESMFESSPSCDKDSLASPIAATLPRMDSM